METKKNKKKNKKRKGKSVNRPQDGDLQNSVIRQIRQIFGYLCQNGLWYGVITTYDHSWFLCRSFEDPGSLLILPAISYNSQDPTLLQCFFHWTSLACGNKDRASDPEPCFSTYHINLMGDEDDDSNDDQPGVGRKGKRSRRNIGRGVEKKEPRNIKGRTSSAKTEATQLQRFDWNTFYVTSVLGGGRSGKVFKATFQQEEVALKICDIWQH